MSRRRPVLALMLGVLLLMFSVAGCGRSAPEPKPAPPAEAAQSPAAQVTVNIITVYLDGRPLANMMPIATRQPNAFDPPLVRGELTREDGSGSLVIPAAEHLYLRAWDPDLKMFANNYLEVVPGAEIDPAPLKVTMATGASLTAQLLTPEGKPAANVTVDLIMSHPTEGPWWPARADAGQQGIVKFPSVPAGRYKIRLQTATGAHLDIDNVDLPPGAARDLGPITLQ